ncbi:radical SAM domain protein [Peptoanaerobacter stomatis]|uniref:Radical SAM domain protein n=1 Tax=Peptoanaerobacter stomatis TaxID=796937 RepID=J5UNU8_9FIRM|nr:radical SAM protein [Peptoanaerobacter stomatis]EJU23974.1 radical SAM domain protein [Peptoanaerobacter stomatis]NWO24208.1 radical SAM protein [Peptostreptococcaceae bacterium oral taxon 081]
MRYEGMVYRPPSEAYSLIVQVTTGCSQNTCTFCAMYKDAKFKIRKVDDIKEDFLYAKNHYYDVERIFLADGDALIMPFEDLLEILKYINKLFPNNDRISLYASPRSILGKTDEQLKILRENNLKMAYLGIESGSDKVLKDIKKKATADEIITAGQKIRRAGIQLSATLIMGLGGIKDSKEHVEGSIKVLNAINPDYLGLMTLLVKSGTEIYDEVMAGNFEQLTPEEIMHETMELVKGLELKDTVVRSNHVSNYAHIKGVLNRDKASILKQIENALKNSDFEKSKRIRQMYARQTGL